MKWKINNGRVVGVGSGVSLGTDLSAVSPSTDVAVVQLLVTTVEERIPISGAAGSGGSSRAASYEI